MTMLMSIRSLMEIIGKAGITEIAIIYVIAIPYTLLIHIGTLSFIISLCYKKTRSRFFKINWIRAISGIYGGLFGLAPFLILVVLHDKQIDNPLFLPLLAMDFPALALTESFSGDSNLLIVFYYVFLGFLGGWGLGQLIEWIIHYFRKNNRHNLASG